MNLPDPKVNKIVSHKSDVSFETSKDFQDNVYPDFLFSSSFTPSLKAKYTRLSLRYKGSGICPSLGFTGVDIVKLKIGIILRSKGHDKWAPR